MQHRGSGGAPPGKFLHLGPLRLLLVAPETERVSQN